LLNEKEDKLTFQAALMLRNGLDSNYLGPNSKSMLIQKYSDELKYLEQDVLSYLQNVDLIILELSESLSQHNTAFRYLLRKKIQTLQQSKDKLLKWRSM